MMCRAYLPLFSALLLSSCTLATPVDTGQANMVTLAPLQQSEIACTKHVKGSIIIAYPVTPDDLDTYRIALLDKGRRDYLSHMRWAEFLPGIIQSTFTQSLNNTNSFDNAFTDDQIVSAHWQLMTEVKRFEVLYDENESPREAVIEMRFELLTGSNTEIKKQFTLSQSVDIQANNTTAIMQAFREGFSKLQNELIAKLVGCSSTTSSSSGI